VFPYTSRKTSRRDVEAPEILESLGSFTVFASISEAATSRLCLILKTWVSGLVSVSAQVSCTSLGLSNETLMILNWYEIWNELLNIVISDWVGWTFVTNFSLCCKLYIWSSRCWFRQLLKMVVSLNYIHLSVADMFTTWRIQEYIKVYKKCNLIIKITKTWKLKL